MEEWVRTREKTMWKRIRRALADPILRHTIEIALVPSLMIWIPAIYEWLQVWLLPIVLGILGLVLIAYNSLYIFVPLYVALSKEPKYGRLYLRDRKILHMQSGLEECRTILQEVGKDYIDSDMQKRLRPLYRDLNAIGVATPRGEGSTYAPVITAYISRLLLGCMTKVPIWHARKAWPLTEEAYREGKGEERRQLLLQDVDALRPDNRLKTGLRREEI